MLTDNDINQLENILFNEAFDEEIYDYFGFHGFVSACFIGPSSMSPEQIYQSLFTEIDNQITVEDKDKIVLFIKKIIKHIKQQLLEETNIQLPLPEDEAQEEEAIQNWCVGFVDGVFENEAEWFAHQPDIVAELLLPVMVLSQLFDDEDFKEIEENEKIIEQFYENLDEIVTDIYLFYHAKK